MLLLQCEQLPDALGDSELVNPNGFMRIKKTKQKKKTNQFILHTSERPAPLLSDSVLICIIGNKM